MDLLTQINADAARRLFEAVENRNSQAVAAIYHRDIVIHEAPGLPYGGEYQGHEGALRHGQEVWHRGRLQEPVVRRQPVRCGDVRGRHRQWQRERR